MNPKTTRILKEARALFWPWCAVMIAGALPLFHISNSLSEISLVFGCAGLALLAFLPFGNEFQHRTLPLLLSQPVSRLEVWGEKLSVTFVAVLSAAMVYCYAWRSEFQQHPQLLVFAGIFFITTIASAPFWTLLARSTMGGLALTNFPSTPFVLIVANWEEILGPNPSPARSITALWTFAFAALGYAGVMLWLGARKLARFQVTGGMAGDDLLMAGPSVMPEALAGLFRCRPTGPFLNLIRKELRLLRPLWLLTMLVVLYLTCLTTFRLMPEPKSFVPGAVAPVALIVPVVLLSLLIAILAGSLSLGEERTSGTQSWHMTLPVSARRQWLIKLVMAMFTGFVCAVLLPVLVMTAGGSIFGSPFMFVDPKGFTKFGWLLAVLFLSFASFWCACAVNGTVRATLWVVPAVAAVFLASGCGDWVAGKLVQTTGTLMDLVVSWFHLSPMYTIPDGPRMTWLVVPTLLLAVIQSYRLFPTQREDSALSMIRCLLPLAMVAFLCTFSLEASGFGFQARRWGPFSETREAIEKLQPSIAKADAAHPLQLTMEDLAKASPLSELTQRWLRNSKITVAPDQAHSGYFATIHLAGGLDCRLAVRHQGGISFYSKWPSCVRRSP